MARGWLPWLLAALLVYRWGSAPVASAQQRRLALVLLRLQAGAVAELGLAGRCAVVGAVWVVLAVIWMQTAAPRCRTPTPKPLQKNESTSGYLPRPGMTRRPWWPGWGEVGDVDLPTPSMNPNAKAKPGLLRVERTVRIVGRELVYLAPKTKGSRRRVPLTVATTKLLREYLAAHPRADTPTAPLFPGMVLGAHRPTGLRAVSAGGKPEAPDGKHVARRQAHALAENSVADAEARLVLDWDEPLRHMTFYKAVYRPAVLRANVLTPTARLSPELKFHSLRHTYASLYVAAGIPPLEIARFMGHAKVTTTLTVYAHLFEDDHADAMDALGAMSKQHAGNVIQLHG